MNSLKAFELQSIQRCTILSLLIICMSVNIGNSQILETEILSNGIVFPRVNTAQRNALSAIQGQCIYNTQSKGVECFDGTNWLAGSESSIKDGDGDTSIDVETTADNDMILFRTEGTEVMRLDGPTIEILNSGESVFIGESAGKSDDLTDNQNTFIGYRAGEDITTGTQNIAIGNQAMRENISGSTNIAIGKEALGKGDGSNNIAIGHNAGRDVSNLTTKNTLIGGFAGFSHAEGGQNTLIGYEAGRSLAQGERNTYIGNEAGMMSNSATVFNNSFYSTSSNTFVGASAGRFFEDGNFNALIGSSAGGGMKEGRDNVAINGTLYQKSNLNVMIGSGEDWGGFEFIGNTMIGGRAGNRNDFSVAPNGRYNTFIGANAGNDQNGTFSVVLGAYKNAFRGFETGGHNNVLIGNHAAASAEGTFYSNKLFIESDTTFNQAGTPLIYGEFDNDLIEINGTLSVKNLPVDASASDLRVDSNGKLVLASSDARLKHDIEPIKNALDKVNQLQGVSFTWNSDPSIGVQFGLIAQDVQKVIPEVVNEHNGLLGVDYTETIGVLIEAIKELSQQNRSLKENQKKLEKLLLTKG